MLDCESVASLQLDSSSMLEAGEGGYSSPMDTSEFDSVAWTVLGELNSSSRSDKKVVLTCA